MTHSEEFIVRQLNWLPIPESDIKTSSKRSKQVIDEKDKFPKGEVIKFYPFQGYGYIKDRNNNEIIFNLDEIDLIGEINNKKDIVVGLKVGYDVSWTSGGLRIKILKVY